MLIFLSGVLLGLIIGIIGVLWTEDNETDF